MRLILSLLLSCLAICSHAAEVLVANTETGLAKSVSVEELREYFLLKRNFYQNGVKVQIFVYGKDSVVSRSFLLNTLKVSPDAYFDTIDSYAATGKSNLPRTVESDTRMIISVAVTKGGLGMVRAAAYAAQVNNIKVIEVK